MPKFDLYHLMTDHCSWLITLHMQWHIIWITYQRDHAREYLILWVLQKLIKILLMFNIKYSTNSELNIQLFFNLSMQRKKCLITQAYWILLLGKWILFSTCPTGMWSFFGEFKLQKNCNQSSYSLPERQPVKLTFFAPCTFF